MASKKNKGHVASRTQDSRYSSVTATEYVPAPAPFSKAKEKRIVVTCTVCNKPFSSKYNMLLSTVCSDCSNKAAQEVEMARKKAEEAELASRVYKTCKICGNEFYIKASKIEKMSALGLQPFACCYKCQQAKPTTDKTVTVSKSEE